MRLQQPRHVGLVDLRRCRRFGRGLARRQARKLVGVVLIGFLDGTFGLLGFGEFDLALRFGDRLTFGLLDLLPGGLRLLLRKFDLPLRLVEFFLGLLGDLAPGLFEIFLGLLRQLLLGLGRLTLALLFQLLA